MDMTEFKSLIDTLDHFQFPLLQAVVQSTSFSGRLSLHVVQVYPHCVNPSRIVSQEDEGILSFE